MKSLKTITSAIVFLFMLLAFTSCDKHDHDHSHAQPSVNFLSPSQGAKLNETDTLWIRINMSAEDHLHDYVIEVNKVADGMSVYKYNGHSHKNNLNTNLYFFPNVSTDTEMKLSVKTFDHDGNTFEKSITFTVLNTKLDTLPIINIISPSLSTATNGQTINIKGNIQHNKNLKSARIWLLKGNDIVLDYVKDNLDANSFDFDTSHVINTNTHTDYLLNISTTDVLNLNAIKSFSFHVHP
jgi:hypothetical protein